MPKHHFIFRRAAAFGFDISNPLHIFIFFLPIFFIAIMMVIFFTDNNLFWVLLREGGLLETFQARSYLLAAVLALYFAVQFHRTKRKGLLLLYIVFTLALLFVTFEEISWGQRIIGFETPEILKTKNIQNETTIHNLDIIQNNLLHRHM